MDWSLVLSAGFGLAGGLAAAGSILWKLSGQLAQQKIEISILTREQKEQKVECERQFDKLEGEFDTFVKEQGVQWQQLSRMLGKIEGEMEAENRQSSHDR